MGREGASTTIQGRSGFSTWETARYIYGRYDKSPRQATISRFKGETTGMLGYIFKCNSELRRWGQFGDNMDTLKTYVSTRYISHIDYLTAIFYWPITTITNKTYLVEQTEMGNPGGRYQFNEWYLIKRVIRRILHQVEGIFQRQIVVQDDQEITMYIT